MTERVHADILVYATGYRVSLPFSTRTSTTPPTTAMPLYQRVLTPDRPGLFFIGFIQTVGANIPLFEYQAQWVGDLITVRRCCRPTTRCAGGSRGPAGHGQAVLRSERHTMQVDYWRYIRA